MPRLHALRDVDIRRLPGRNSGPATAKLRRRARIWRTCRGGAKPRTLLPPKDVSAPNMPIASPDPPCARRSGATSKKAIRGARRRCGSSVADAPASGRNGMPVGDRARSPRPSTGRGGNTLSFRALRRRHDRNPAWRRLRSSRFSVVPMRTYQRMKKIYSPLVATAV